MKRLLFLLVFSAVAAFGKIPVILDTDIGTDIDDSWALAMLLRSPELDVKLVLSDSGDTVYRAKLLAKFLTAAGRTDIPVAAGFNQGPMKDEDMNLAPLVKDYDVAAYPGHYYADGIHALIETIKSSQEPVTVIAIGAVPNLAKALEKEPLLFANARFVGMHGSFRVGYGGKLPLAAEANVKGDPSALRAVLGAPWKDILLTPLDTCGVVSVSGDDYHQIWCRTDDPLLRHLIESYCVFAPRVRWMTCDFFTSRSTTLFDCVAVYLASSERLVNVETLSFDVTADGFTTLSANGPFRARVATSWNDQKAFEHLIATRLLTK